MWCQWFYCKDYTHDIIGFYQFCFITIWINIIIVVQIWCFIVKICKHDCVCGWCMRAWVHGCMVHGAWCMVHGAWCMVHGAWCMVHGAWCMVHGAWCMGACVCVHVHVCACVCIEVIIHHILSLLHANTFTSLHFTLLSLKRICILQLMITSKMPFWVSCPKTYYMKRNSTYSYHLFKKLIYFRVIEMKYNTFYLTASTLTAPWCGNTHSHISFLFTSR